jgi:hypothetical protein
LANDIAAGADVVVPGNPIRGRSRLKENQGNIICDACNPPSACDLRRAICSNRGGSWKSRTSFFVTSSWAMGRADDLARLMFHRRTKLDLSI